MLSMYINDRDISSFSVQKLSGHGLAKKGKEA
jgi:hypothetical protein